MAAGAVIRRLWSTLDRRQHTFLVRPYGHGGDVKVITVGPRGGLINRLSLSAYEADALKEAL